MKERLTVMPRTIFFSGLASFQEDVEVNLSRDTYNAYQIANGGETAGPSAFPRTLEWEFSTNAIIINTRINSDDPVSIRNIVYGSFEYNSSGSLTSASIDNSYTVYRHDDGFEYGYFDDPGFSIKVTHPNSFAAWDTAMSLVTADNFIVHQYEIDDGEIVNIDGEGYAGIFNNANSLFLPSDWHQQLFSSNLLQGSTSEVSTLQEGAVDLRGSSDVDDVLIGDESDNKLVGVRGKDILIGGDGGDELRAGNGRDIINGGDGSDTMYGGFGLNTFEDADDGEIDQLFFKSDQHAYNWIYDKDGNSPKGEKADKIMELDPFDEIFVQGVETEELDFQNVVHYSNLGETLDGIGIYASGTLEAVYVGDNLSISQLESMTQGII